MYIVSYPPFWKHPDHLPVKDVKVPIEMAMLGTPRSESQPRVTIGHALRGAIRETWAKRLGVGCDGRCCLGKSIGLGQFMQRAKYGEVQFFLIMQ